MDNQNLIAQLKTIFPEYTWPWAIPALQHDAVLWEKLHDTPFRNILIDKLGRKPILWTPANIAALAMDLNVPQELLTTSQSPTEIPFLLEKAKVLYRDFHAEPHPLRTLSDMGYLAIAILDDFNRTGNWHNTLKNFFAKVDSNLFNQTIKTTFSCLLGWVETPNSFLSPLYQVTETEELCVHVILSNPTTEEDKIKIFSKLIKASELSNQYRFLYEINKSNPSLAKAIAKEMTKVATRHNFPSPANNIPTLSKEIDSLLAKNGIFSIASEKDKAQQYLQHAWDSTRKLTTEIGLRIAQQAVQADQLDLAFSTWENLAPEVRKYKTPKLADFVNELIFKRYLKEAKKVIQDVSQNSSKSTSYTKNTTLAFAKALMHFEEGSLQESYQNAKIVLEDLQNANSKTFYEKYSKENLQKLTHLLLDLGYPYDAYLVSKKTKKYYPNDLVIVETHYKTLAAMNPHTKNPHLQEEAIETAHLAIALAPENIELRRNLAKAYQDAKMWDEANNQWVEILDKQTTPKIDDLRSYALCAWQAGFKEQAIKACQYGLDINPEDGLTSLLLGKIYESDGSQKKAYDYYSQALKYSPDKADVWLEYANSLLRQEKAKEAIAILHRGLNAIPNNLQLKQRLGEIHLESKDYKKAIDFLESVHDSLNQLPVAENNHLKVKNASALGNAYYQTDQYKQAIHTLQEVHKAHPTEPTIAYRYAQALLADNRPKDAIPPLIRVLQTNPKDTTPYLDYAKAQLAAEQDAKEAIKSLEHVLKTNPENNEALALLGDAYLMNKQYKEALTSYKKAMETPLKENPTWLVRLLHGIGKVALQTNDTDTAIVTLKQAKAEDPNNVDVLKTLANAYLKAQLIENASEISQTILRKKPEDVDTHLWYADIAKSMEQTSEAIKVLKRAHEISPDRQDVQIALGKTYFETGNLELARQTFEEIAENSNSTIHSLQIAADHLLELGEENQAIKALSQALKIANEVNAKTQEKIDITINLAKVLQAQNKQKEAIELINEISQDADELPIKLMKVQLLHILGRPQAAIAALEDAMNVYPENPECHYMAAQIYRSQGDLKTALFHVEKAVNLLPGNIKAQTLAAEVNAALLNKTKTKELVISLAKDREKSIDAQISPEYTRDLRYQCLIAEQALEENDDIQAANALTNAMKIDEKHPRVLAIQARLAARRGEIDAGNKLLTEAIEKLGKAEKVSRHKTPVARINDVDRTSNKKASSPLTAEDYFGLAEAALELNQWNISKYLSKEGAHLAPFEPQSHLNVVRFIVENAEIQRISKSLLIETHAPGDSALSHASYEEFESAIEKSRSLLKEQVPHNNNSMEIINQWEMRGEAVFNPSKNIVAKLEQNISNPKLTCSLIQAYRLMGNTQKAAEKAIDFFERDEKLILNTPKYATIVSLGILDINPQQALTITQKAIDIAQNNQQLGTPVLFMLLSKIASKSAKYEIATKAIEKAMETWGDEPNWHAFAADILLSREKAFNKKSGAKSISHQTLTEIIEHREKSIELAPNHVPFQISLAKTYQLAGRLFDAIQLLEDVTQKSPENPDAWIALSKIYQQGNDLDKAIAMCKKAIEIDPTNQSNLTYYANLLVENGDYKAATDVAERLTKTDAQNADAYHLLAKSLIGLNRKDEAIKALERAQHLSPDNVALELEKINLLELTKGKEIAFQALRQLSDKYHDNIEIQTTFAKELVKRNQFHDAIRVIKNAIGLINQQENTTDNVAELHYLLGNLYRRTGQLDHAIHHLSQSLSIDPNNIKTYIEAGKAYQDSKQYQKAIQAFEAAIEITPTAPEPYYYAGLTYKSIKDYLNAENMFRKAAEYAPNDLNIHRQLGAMVAINLVHNRQSFVNASAD